MVPIGPLALLIHFSGVHVETLEKGAQKNILKDNVHSKV